MEFADILELVFSDKRSSKIPILFIVQVIIILQDLDLLKEK